MKKTQVLLSIFIVLLSVQYSCKKDASKSSNPVTPVTPPHDTTIVSGDYRDSLIGYYAGSTSHDSSDAIIKFIQGEFQTISNTYPQRSFTDTLHITKGGHDSLLITSTKYAISFDTVDKAIHIGFDSIALYKDPANTKRISMLHAYNNPNVDMYVLSYKSRYFTTATRYSR
ncbi:MAG: hypothetical protein JWQ38_2872 [Flavipsychrobacter sp.]|nr:hypothetical protein [Flavipsychrobacter sp.]